MSKEENFTRCHFGDGAVEIEAWETACKNAAEHARASVKDLPPAGSSELIALAEYGIAQLDVDALGTTHEDNLAEVLSDLEFSRQRSAAHLYRSVRVVHARVKALGLGIGRMGPGRVWISKEIEYVRKNYSTTPNRALQAALGRSKKSLIPKASSLGLSKVYKWRNKPRRRIP